MSLEQAIVTLLYQPHGTILNETAAWLTIIGSSMTWLVTFTAIHLHTDNTKLATTGILTTLTTGITTIALKYLFQRPPPTQATHLTETITTPYVFPSGHTATIAAAATLLALNKPKYTPLYITAILIVGLTRLILGVHYPTDIIAGALLGTAITLALHTKTNL